MSVTESVRTRARQRSRAPRLSWPGLIMLAAGVFLSITIEMLPTGLLPEMSEGLGVAEPLIGLLVSVFAFTVVITSTPLTALTSRMPRHGLLAAVLGVLGVTTLASAFVPEYWMLVAIRVIGGVAHGLFWALVAAYAARLVPEDRIGRAVSVTLGGGTLALVVGVPATTVLGQVIGWRPVFAVVAALTLVGALAVWRFLPPVGADSAPTAARLGRSDVALWPVLLVCAVTAVTMLGQYAVFTYVAPLITDVVGLDATSVGPLLFVYGVAGAVGLAIAGSPLARRPVHGMVGAMAVAAVALSVLGGAPGVWPSIIAFAVWGLAFGAIPPLLQTRLLQQRPRATGMPRAPSTRPRSTPASAAAPWSVHCCSIDSGCRVLPFVYAALLVAVALTLVLSRGMFGAGRRAQPASTKVATAVGPVRSPAL